MREFALGNCKSEVAGLALAPELCVSAPLHLCVKIPLSSVHLRTPQYTLQLTVISKASLLPGQRRTAPQSISAYQLVKPLFLNLI
jgi:hypothetical protein